MVLYSGSYAEEEHKRKSKKTGGRGSDVPMTVVIGVGLLALAAALLLVTRTDLGRQLMTAVPSGSPTPTPSGIVWGCKPPAQNGCKCTYSNPQESAAPIKTAYLPAYFKLCSSKLGGSRLSSDATSVERKVCVDECSDYIKVLGYNEESPGWLAGAVSAGMCYKVGGSSPVPCAKFGVPEPFIWDKCEIQCRCLYKKDTSTQVLAVPNTPVSLEGSFCSASGYPPANMLEKFVGGCPSRCEDATPPDWEYVKLVESAEYLGKCDQTVQCDPADYYPTVGFLGGGVNLWPEKRERHLNPWAAVIVSDYKGERIGAPYDIKVLVSTRTRMGRHIYPATPGRDFRVWDDKEFIIYKGQELIEIARSYEIIIDDTDDEEREEFRIHLEVAPGEKANVEEGQDVYPVIIEDDDGPAASDTPAPSETP